MVWLSEWLRHAGETEEAWAWLRRSAEAGDPLAMQLLAGDLQTTGRVEEVEAWRRRAVEADDPDEHPGALADLALWLEKSGRVQEATRLENFGIEPGGYTADPWTIPGPLAQEQRTNPTKSA
jgi:hypothetical protein